MIIDAHMHIEGLPDSPWRHSPELVLEVMDRAAITKAFVMTYVNAPLTNNAYDPIEYVKQAIRRYPDRFIGFIRLHPGHPKAVELLERAITDWGFKGLKLHPYGCKLPPDSEETIRLLKKAGQLKIPALFHCGDEEHTLPLEIERAAINCPETTIILGHMGGYFHVEDAIAVATRRANVFLETSAMPKPRYLTAAVNAIGYERILYGSDGPGCDPRLEVYKVEHLGLPVTALAAIFHHNAERLTRGPS